MCLYLEMILQNLIFSNGRKGSQSQLVKIPNQVKFRIKQNRLILLQQLYQTLQKKMCFSSPPFPDSFSSLSYGVSPYQYQQTFTFAQATHSYPKIVDDQVLSSKLRILQDNLVFVSGLPSEIANIDVLGSDLYFGRYGVVQKIIINQSSQSKKNPTYQAYVTYWNSIDASLAIVALDGFTLKGKALKVSYGTTKYCAYFLKGFECPNSECFYLHKQDPSKELTSTDSKEVFKKQIAVAVDTVQSNFIEIVGKTLMNANEYVLKGLPTINEVIDYLHKKKYIEQNTIDFAFRFIRGQVYQNQIKGDSFCQMTNISSTCLGNECLSEQKYIKQAQFQDQYIKTHKKSFSFLENQFYSTQQDKIQTKNKLVKSHSSLNLNSPSTKTTQSHSDTQSTELFDLIQQSTKNQKQIYKRQSQNHGPVLDRKIQSMICKQLLVKRRRSQLGFPNILNQSNHSIAISKIILKSLK